MEKKTCKILGFENLYEIYEDGSLFSVRKQRLLTPSLNSSGYLMHNLTPHPGEVLSKHVRKKYFMVHRLVLIHFIEPPPFERAECNHKDHDKRNNHWSNLEWVSHSDNIYKSFREGGRNGPMLGVVRGPYSEEVRRKMGLAKEKPVWGEFEGVRVDYRSIQDAADALGVDRRGVNRSIYGTRQLRSGHRFGFIDVVKLEKELLGHPFVHAEKLVSEDIPIDMVPDISVLKLGPTPQRIGRNLYANDKGYIVRHWVGRDLISRRFDTKDAVEKTYGLGKYSIKD